MKKFLIGSLLVGLVFLTGCTAKTPVDNPNNNPDQQMSDEVIVDDFDLELVDIDFVEDSSLTPEDLEMMGIDIDTEAGCPDDLYLCSDGVTSVGRSGPDCVFDLCPEGFE